MLIEITLANGQKKNVVLCLPAISPKPNEAGLYWSEFYPVNLLLKERETDQMLEGHPVMDLIKVDTDLAVRACGEHLSRRRASEIITKVNEGLMVALGQALGLKDGRLAKVTSFYYVEESDYLTEDDIFWLEVIRQSSYIFKEELDRKEKALAEAKVAKSKKKPPKKRKLKRKDRRKMELERVKSEQAS